MPRIWHRFQASQLTVLLGALSVIAIVLLALAAALVRLRLRGRAGRWLVLAVALACALSTGITAHLGGRLAFGEPEAEDAS